jgi:hypothetical protein
MPRQFILGMGAGQCGMNLLTEILQKQADTRITYEQWPVLPWLRKPGLPGIRERLARWNDTSSESIVGDVAAFYLPYVEEAIECNDSIRLVCLKRLRGEVIAGYVRNLNETCRVPTNHWSETPLEGWYHDPLWTQTFPQYPTSDREEAIGLYWDEYYERAEELARRFPTNFLLIDTDELTEMAGVRRLLDFVGIPRDTQIPIVGNRPKLPAEQSKSSPPPMRDPLDPKRCVVLVPFNGFIHPECEDALKELERRGYAVRRVGGYAAIDQGRNQMVTDALMAGFEETLWIDSDVGFHPDEVERLRSHPEAIVTGIYPQKGKRALASHIVPGTPNLTFGEGGGLIELLYAATGFMLIRREAYLGIQRHLQLPTCNERFGHAMIPFFLPLIRKIDDGHWYLAEDYSFCERARQSGFKIWADTRIRLWHVGWYRYGWEDAGIERPRFNSFTLNFSKPQGGQPTSDPMPIILERFAKQNAWPAERPDVPQPPERNWLFEGTKRALSETIPREATLIVEVGSWLGRSTRFLCELAPKSRVIAIDHWQGSPEHGRDPELVPLLPRLYETFLSESWEYRKQIIPVRTGSVDGLQRVASAGLVPDAVYIDADHSYESVMADLSVALDLFPKARIVGDDWDWEGVHRAVQTVADQRKLRVEVFGAAWRIVR